MTVTAPTEEREPLAAPRETGIILYRWLILTLLTIGILIAFVDRVSISAAMTVPDFKTQFGLTDVGRGWLNSAFFWSYAVMQIPMGWVVDRYGVKWPYAVCFLVWCAASAAVGLVSTLWALILDRKSVV